MSFLHPIELLEAVKVERHPAGETCRHRLRGGRSVSAVSREAASQCADALVVCEFPDICLTPMGGAMVPVGYQIIARLEDAECLSEDVLFNDEPAFTLGSRLPRVEGDEAVEPLEAIDLQLLDEGNFWYDTVGNGSDMRGRFLSEFVKRCLDGERIDYGKAFPARAVGDLPPLLKKTRPPTYYWPFRLVCRVALETCSLCSTRRCDALVAASCKRSRCQVA